MLKILMLFVFTLISTNITFAKSRFSDAEKQKFMDDVKQSIAKGKMDNQGKIDLQLIKPDLNDELEIYVQQQKMTREEALKIKNDFEKLAKDPSITPDKAEDTFIKFVQDELNNINKTQVTKIQEGKVCNNWGCEDGLKCAPDPKQEDGPSCKKQGTECKVDGDCCSSSCTLDKKTKKRFCEEVYRCFKPLALGQSCMQNPVCGEGDCLAFNARTVGIGECSEKGIACKKNVDCCSNLCSGNKCVESYICKDCVKNGMKPTRGQKCCEGLYLNENGKCAPMIPPKVMPEVNIPNKILNFVASLFINDAMALVDITTLDPTSGGGSGTGSTTAPAPTPTAAEIASALATKLGAASSSPADLASALETYTETPADVAQMKTLASLDPSYQSLYDAALAQEAVDDAKAAGTVAQAQLDNVDMAAQIMTDQSKYSNFSKGQSITTDNTKFVKPNMNFDRKSNFGTCDIYFKDDFFNYLKSQKFTTSGCEYSIDSKGVYTVVNNNTANCTVSAVQAQSGKADSSLLDMELALLAFDYVFLGDGVNDYWTKSSDPNSSIYGRLKAIAKDHQKLRADTNAKVDVINHKLTCMCLDVIGDENIKDATKKAWFESQCDEYKNPQGSQVCTQSVKCSTEVAGTPSCDSSGNMLKLCDAQKDGPSCTCTSYNRVITTETASGVKGKNLLVTWTKNLADFNASLTVDNTNVYTAINAVSQWSANEANWNQVRLQTFDLFNFNLKNPSGSVAAMGAILGALLAAGAIAVLGGFASGSILSAWAIAGIITTSAVTGGTGLWLLASLKGAWISQRPEIVDKFVRSYSCGKKETCQEWKRTLNQPYNDICNIHASANACIKNFVVYYQDQEPRYVVDPWIPAGVTKSLVLRDAPERLYTQRLESAFTAAKSHMIAKNPGATGGEGKDGGQYVSEDYMRTVFLDTDILTDYAKGIITPDGNANLINDQVVAEIKKQAIQFAIKERFFYTEPNTTNQTSKYCAVPSSNSQDTQPVAPGSPLQSVCAPDKSNLDEFANYAYNYHFLWPKTSRLKEISYPTIGLTAYLDLMSNGVVANMAVGAGNATRTFGTLNTQYLTDYLNTLQIYADKPSVIANKPQLQALQNEIKATQAALAQQKLFNALAGEFGQSVDLKNLDAKTMSAAISSSGVGGDTKLSDNQQGALRAIGTLRSARKVQVAKLNAYNKAIAASGDTDRANKVATAAKKFSSGFGSPLSGSKNGGLFGSSFGSGSGSGSGDGSDSSGKKNKNGDGNRNGYGGNSYGLNGPGAIHKNGDGSGGDGSGGDGSGNGKDGNGANGSGLDANGMSEEDRRRLAEAIAARDKASQDKYSTKPDQTLFEIITNTYIRNYDKVLTKKKSDKDVLEQK